MIQLDLIQDIPAPPERAWAVFWERFSDMPMHIAEIDAITPVDERWDGEHRTLTVHRWQASPTLIPAMARPFVKPTLICWNGHAEWLHAERTVRFDFRHDRFEGLYNCTGSFVVDPGEDADASRVTIHGELEIHPERLSGLPRGLARKASGWVERVLLSAVEPALAALPLAVDRFLEEYPDGELRIA
ncbi:MAG: hypothetical protein D6761_01795 [Candidatus Dadabacteria bacterium]|nr:MAG: hypothetical protein D6761_01795 [Candidatus Dadabacteria bacterium]